jgi:hypothetical protein
VAEGTHERPTGIGFRQYSWKVACRAFKDIKWMRDMAIGACVSVASVVLRASLGIMSRSDRKLHGRQWIASIVLPIIAWMAIRIAYRLLTAPWRVHQDQESVHDVEMQVMRVELQVKSMLCFEVGDLFAERRLGFSPTVLLEQMQPQYNASHEEWSNYEDQQGVPPITSG